MSSAVRQWLFLLLGVVVIAGPALGLSLAGSAHAARRDTGVYLEDGQGGWFDACAVARVVEVSRNFVVSGSRVFLEAGGSVFLAGLTASDVVALVSGACPAGSG